MVCVCVKHIVRYPALESKRAAAQLASNSFREEFVPNVCVPGVLGALAAKPGSNAKVGGKPGLFYV